MSLIFETKITLWLPEGTEPNLARKQHAELLKYTWDIAFHWLIKFEFDNKHKIPCSRKLANELKSQGEFLRAIFSLCKELHPLLSTKYPDYWHLFKACWGEWIIGGCWETIFPISAPNARDKKEASIAPIHSSISAAKRLDNPFVGSDMRANALLLDAAISMANRFEIFNKKTYRPFVKAWRDWAKDIDKNYCRTFEKDGHLYQQIKTNYKRKII
jgi:hypothetical protein